MSSYGSLAKQMISIMDQAPHSKERAKHKLAMIEIAEKEFVGIPLPDDVVMDRFELAGVWCKSMGLS